MKKNSKTAKKTVYKTDQEKYNHREEVKHHKTKKHFLSSIREQEAEKQIRLIPPCVGHAYQDE